MPDAREKQRALPITPEGRASLLNSLSIIEQKAKNGLTSALTGIGVEDNDPVRALYENLSTEGIKKPWTLKTFLKGVGEITWGGFWGKASTISVAIGTGLGILREAALNWDSFRIFYNNLIAWSFTGVEKGTDPLAALSTASTAAIVLAIPTLAVSTVTKITERRTAVLIDRANRVNAAHNALEAGEANLNYLVGPNVHILVGKSDPSAETLIKMFHDVGIEVITFWDESKAISSKINPFWLRTRNMWTRADVLNKASLENTLCMFSEVSKGSDVFLSRRSGTFSRLYEDMSDAESRNANTKANFLLKQRGIKRTIPLIAVTNIKREVEGVVTGDVGATYGTKTEGDLYAKHKHMHPSHVDGIITGLIAKVAVESDLPVEFITDPHRQHEYEQTFTMAINDHNGEKPNSTPTLRYKTKEDGKKTLTCFYGDDDQTTLKLLEGFLEEASQEGDFLVIINDPEVIGELPEEIRKSKKYICIGEILAKEQFGQFVELTNNGEISLPANIKANLGRYLAEHPQLFTVETGYRTFHLTEDIYLP